MYRLTVKGTSFNHTKKTSATFALTEPTMDHTMTSSKSPGLHNFMSMTYNGVIAMHVIDIDWRISLIQV